MRLIEPHDLELYAINTGEFYELHKTMAFEDHHVWEHHVLKRVLPHYSREIEPVQASPKTVAQTTMALKAYYQRHVIESRALETQTATKDLK